MKTSSCHSHANDAIASTRLEVTLQMIYIETEKQGSLWFLGTAPRRKDRVWCHAEKLQQKSKHILDWKLYTPKFCPSWGFFKACLVSLTDSYIKVILSLYIYIQPLISFRSNTHPLTLLFLWCLVIRGGALLTGQSRHGVGHPVLCTTVKWP